MLPTPIRNFRTSTGYIIDKNFITPTALTNLKSKMSIIDFNTNEEIPKAIFDREGYIFIPRITRNVLDYILGNNPNFEDIKMAHNPSTKELKLDSNWKPLPYQAPLIEEGAKQLLVEEDKRLCICLSPGLGKTFCTSAILEKVNCKFLFMCYSKRIVKQSIDAMTKHFGGNRGFFQLEHGSDFEELRYDKINGLFMTHSMLKSLIKTYTLEKVCEVLFSKIGINMKVLDEFDREVASMYFMDANMNFKYSIYLTGTKYKSLKPDDRLFQLIFRKVKTLGKDVKIPENKEVLFMHFNYNPSRQEYFKIMRVDQTFKVYYNNYLAQKDSLLDFIMGRFYVEDTGLIKKTKLFRHLLSEDGQIQFFTGRIENCEIVRDKLIKNFGIHPLDVGIINSNISTKEKLENINKPWLVTTAQSLGRGVDSDKVRAIVMMEFHFSKSELTQIVNRVGRIGKKYGYFIYPVDHSFSKIMLSYNSKVRDGLFREGFKANRHFEITNEYCGENYVNGYRLGSDKANEILEANKKITKKASRDIKRAFGRNR